MSNAATKLPRWCRWFGHSWRPTEWDAGHWSSSDRHERYTHSGVRTCWRCATTERVEWFDSRMYWDSVSRDREDERLERIIRHATR